MPDARSRILIADDEPVTRQMLGQVLADEGHGVLLAADGEQALSLFERTRPDMVLTDLRMPGLDGQALLLKVHEIDPHVPVVIMTAQGSIRSAVESLRAGAADYITKPVPLDDLLDLVRRCLPGAARESASSAALPGILGRSRTMQEIARLTRQIAPTNATVLFTGESGTGKDALARALHGLSRRAEAPFVKVSCAALSETLLESELFGHERGAFTGAVARRAGRFEAASGGTLFLDEVGDIPPAVQIRLLRFLQDRQFERVGGNITLTVDTRVIAATHRDLAAGVREGTFREDLYWRLKVIEIPVPPLRARAGDIPLLASHFLNRFARLNGRKLHGLSAAALAGLMTYGWPGNVREMENAIERAVVLARGRTLGPELFPMLASSSPGLRAPVIPGASLEEIEKEAILRTLEAVGGSSTRAAAILRISARTIQYKRKQWLTDVCVPADPPQAG